MSRSIRAKILDGSFKPMMGKRIEYDGNFYRLSYEVTRAKYLTEQNIPWRYEEITYDLGDTTYTPYFSSIIKRVSYVELKMLSQHRRIRKNRRGYIFHINEQGE